MKPIFLIHFRLYVLFTLTVFLPQLALIFVPAWRIPTFSFAFLGIIVIARLLLGPDKDYREQARLIAQKQLQAFLNRTPSKEEVEAYARKIMDGRIFVFYFSGALSFALAYLSTVV